MCRIWQLNIYQPNVLSSFIVLRTFVGNLGRKSATTVQVDVAVREE